MDDADASVYSMQCALCTAIRNTFLAFRCPTLRLPGRAPTTGRWWCGLKPSTGLLWLTLDVTTYMVHARLIFTATKTHLAINNPRYTSRRGLLPRQLYFG